MLIDKEWYVKDNKLYRPKKGRNELLVIWFYIIFTTTLYVLKPVTISNFFYYVMLLIIVGAIINFYRLFKQFGVLGHPILYFSTTKIVLYGQDKSLEIDVYPDDEIHIVGLKNNRFIRFVNKKYGNREVKPISQRLIKFILNRLKNKHQVIYQGYPNILSQFRGDF